MIGLNFVLRMVSIAFSSRISNMRFSPIFRAVDDDGRRAGAVSGASNGNGNCGIMEISRSISPVNESDVPVNEFDLFLFSVT